MKVGEWFMKYIEKSPEQPLGEVKKLWWRWEWQGTMGNLPHIHALLWILYNSNSEEGLRKLRERIICRTRDVMTEMEIYDYMNKGKIKDWDDAFKIQELFALIQSHNCEKANYRCMKRKGVGSKDLQCRVPNYSLNRFDCSKYDFLELHPNHTEDVIELLVELNLCEKTERDGEVLYKFHEKFRGGKHQYPAEIGEHCIPCNGYLFLIQKSHKIYNYVMFICHQDI